MTRIPGAPGWAPTVPNDRWADPADDRPVEIPCSSRSNDSTVDWMRDCHAA